MKALIVLAAVAVIAATEEKAPIVELGPWAMTTIMPDGRQEHFGSWMTRELCEADIAKTEARAHSYGSECYKDPKLEAAHIRVQRRLP